MAERFTVELEHPGDREAATLALRLALKRLWRDHRLRCVELHPADSDAARAIQRQQRLDSQASSIPITSSIGVELPRR